MTPGEYILSANPITCNENKKTINITVSNRGDRPCQIGSHTHFFEVNRALDFPRDQTFGYRLNIPAGTSIRFEPGDTKEVELCELGGIDRKSTRLNSSHANISYAVFCL